MDPLLLSIILDVLVLATVIVQMVRRMTFWHPLATYLLFHFYSFTQRALNIYGGSPLMYANQANTEAITIDEITRAMLWADVGLVTFAAASWWAHRRFEARIHAPVARKVLNPKIVKFIAVLCLPVGIAFFFSLKAGTLDLSVDAASAGYVQVMGMWPIGVIGLLIFTFGFRWYLVALAAFFLGVVALQGYHRFMLILPLLFLTACYLQSHRRRWPTLLIVIGAIFVGLVFPRLKYIGRAVENGDTGEAIAQFSQAFVKDTKSFTATEAGEDFLDQFAGGLTLIDYNDRKFWGSTYLAIITLPIPRAWWPKKPGLADHLREITTYGRNYSEEGRIITYLGESYLNFGYAGLFIIPALMGYLLTAYCLHATTGPMRRLSRYVYLVGFMALIQTFRDGLLSIFVFTIVHNMPMFFALILHALPGFADKSLDRPAADPRASEEEQDIAREEARSLGGPEGQWRR